LESAPAAAAALHIADAVDGADGLLAVGQHGNQLGHIHRTAAAQADDDIGPERRAAATASSTTASGGSAITCE
jgi:hypothetical protein